MRNGDRIGLKKRIAFGDFQTPPGLATRVARLLAEQNVRPASVVEPSCGQGNFLAAAQGAFPHARHLGFEINPDYVRVCQQRVGPGAAVVTGDFFATDWAAVLGELAEPLLLVGNPPWVTTAALSVVASDNAPQRSSAGLTGLDAITGRANFDISEWMLRHLIEHIEHRDATLAMLVKTAVARKLLDHMWRLGRGPRDARIYTIDARTHFGAAVGACLLVCRFPGRAGADSCAVYSDLADTAASSRIAHRDGQLIADLERYERTRALIGDGLRWRSGVKHDCAAILELWRDGDHLRNGLGERVELEPDYLFPMLKSSELSRDRAPRRVMLVTQRHTSDATDHIARVAPRTWRYLLQHRERLARRASSIYRDRPPFAVFGVGDYTFAPWKVAVSGFYAQLAFRAVGPQDGKPVVFDDTCYFVPCASRAEAEARARLLNSDAVRDFFAARIFGDTKRPVTARLLGQLNVDALA